MENKKQKKKKSVNTTTGVVEKLEKIKLSGFHDPNGVVRDLYLPRRSRETLFCHQSATIARGGLVKPILGIDFHLEYPFLAPFKIGGPRFFRKKAFCCMHYLVDAYKIAISVNFRELLYSFKECLQNLYYCTHLMKFWELFLPIELWYKDVEYMMKTHCDETDQYGLLLLGHNFSGDQEKGHVHVTIEWLNLSKEDTYEMIQQDEELCMYFRSKMLAENGYDEMKHLHLIKAELFDYDDYPRWYVERLKDATTRFESKTSPNSADYYEGGYESRDEEQWNEQPWLVFNWD